MALKFIDTKKIPSEFAPKLDESVIVKDFPEQFYALITRKSVRTGSICSLAIKDKAERVPLLNNIKSVEFRNNLRDYAADVFQATRLPVIGTALTNNIDLGDSYAQVVSIPSFIESGDTVFFVRPVNGSYSGDPGHAEGPFYIDEIKDNSFKIFPRAPQVFDSSYVVLFLSKNIAAVDFLQSGMLQNYDMISIEQGNTLELSDTVFIENEARAYKVMNKEVRNSVQTDLRLFPLPKVAHPEGKVVYSKTPINNAPSYALPSGSSRFNFNFVYDTKPEDDFVYVLKNTLQIGDVFYIENNTLIPYTILEIDNKFPTIDKIKLNKQVGKYYRGIKQGPFNAGIVRLFNSNNDLIEVKDISKNTSIVSISFDESNQTPYFLVSALDSKHNYTYYFVAGDFPSFQPDYLTRSLSLKYLNNSETPIDFAVYQNAVYVLTDAKKVIAYSLKGVAMEVFNFEHIDDEITSIDYFSDFVSIKTTFKNPIKKNIDNFSNLSAVPEYVLARSTLGEVERGTPGSSSYRPPVLPIDDSSETLPIRFAGVINPSEIRDTSNPEHCYIVDGPLSDVKLSVLTLRHLMAFDGYFKYWRIKKDPNNASIPKKPIELEWIGPENRSLVYQDELSQDNENEFIENYKYITSIGLSNALLLKSREDWQVFYNQYLNSKFDAVVHSGPNKSTQLDNINRKFSRYLILFGSSGGVYFYDLIINRTALATSTALNKPDFYAAGAVKKINNKLKSIDLREEFKYFMTHENAESTVSTCRNLGISYYDYQYKENISFKNYEEYLSSLYDSSLRPLIKEVIFPDPKGGVSPIEALGLELIASPPSSLLYEKELLINSAITEGVDMTQSVLYNASFYRVQQPASDIVSIHSVLNKQVSKISLTINKDSYSNKYTKNIELVPPNNKVERVIQSLCGEISKLDEFTTALFNNKDKVVEIKSKTTGIDGNSINYLLEFELFGGDLLAFDGNLKNGLSITNEEFKLDMDFPSISNGYIERNNLYPVISGSSDSKAGIMLLSSNLNLKSGSFEYSIKAWGDHGETIPSAEITPNLTIYSNKNYNNPVIKIIGDVVTTDNRGIANGAIEINRTILNNDSDSVDFLVQFKTKVIHQPNFNSIYIYELSQTNVKGDEKISFKVFGMKNPSVVKFKLIHNSGGSHLPGSPILVREVFPSYRGDEIFELDFKDFEVTSLTSVLENDAVLALEALEEINVIGKRYNQSNSVAIIYTGLENNT